MSKKNGKGPSENEIRVDEFEAITSATDKIYREKNPEKLYKRFINDITNSIRSTPEYKLWRDLCQRNWEATQGPICGCCDGAYEEMGLKSDVHHTPVTLGEIIESVLQNMRGIQSEITTGVIIEQILELHVEGKIPNMVVCECCHKRLHYEKKTFGEEVTLTEKSIRASEPDSE